MQRQDLLVGQTARETPTGDEALTDEQREMLEQLERYIKTRQVAGERVEWLGISTGTWLALGKPEIAAGVRVVPVGPQTELPEEGDDHVR